MLESLKSQIKPPRPKCPYGPQQLIPFDSDLIDGIMGFQLDGTNYLAVPYAYVIDGVEHILDDDDYRYTNDDLEDEETMGTVYVEPEYPGWKPLFEDDVIPDEARKLEYKESWITNVLNRQRIVREVVKAIRVAKADGWSDDYSFEYF